MNQRVRLVFFLVGIIAIIIMMFSFDLTLDIFVHYLVESGWYFPLAILLWSIIYLFNTFSWHEIIKNISTVKIPFTYLYKFTISGFALNYVTPGGMNGGEPYRILELKPYLGTSAAVSTTIIYSIAHIVSHLLFWMIGAFLFLIFYNTYQWISVTIIVLGVLLIALFIVIMRYGLVNLITLVALRLPFTKSWCTHFITKHQERIVLIDQQVRSIYDNDRKALLQIIGIELMARLIGCVEILLIPILFNITFIEAYLVIAISSLMGNLLFFMPMQLGGREGGFVLAFSLLGISTDYGIFVAILFRLRELIAIVLGIGLIQLKLNSKY